MFKRIIQAKWIPHHIILIVQWISFEPFLKPKLHPIQIAFNLIKRIRLLSFRSTWLWILLWRLDVARKKKNGENKNNMKWKKGWTYRYRCRCYRCNSFPIEWNNQSRTNHRYKRIYIHRPPVHIVHGVSNHSRIQLKVWGVENREFDIRYREFKLRRKKV